MPGTKKKSYSATPSIRLNELAGPLIRQAKKEQKKPAEVIRLALKHYLEGGAVRIADTAGLVAELRALRSDFARAGNNLNQLAHYFNVHDTTDTQELRVIHDDLRRSFWEATQLLKAVHGELEKSM